MDELQSPVHRPMHWAGGTAHRNELGLAAGARIVESFSDPGGLLQTAYGDLRAFLKMGGVLEGQGVPIITRKERTGLFEEYSIAASDSEVLVCAADTEGIRRGLIHLEDMMLRRGGPFLPKGRLRRKPIIQTRISRCFYGPINRPPKHRDELADDVNYYPDEYLNRLAHDGVNGLWLTITFRDTVPSRIIPEFGRDSARRLEKLRQTVRRCARYGIRIYPFCIEPAGISLDSPLLSAHPEIAGHRRGEQVAICPSSRKVQAYLEEATRTLFSDVPGLGGLIVITVGERLTHCYSASGSNINCPRCSSKRPREVLALELSAMERGMHAVAPRAELISWPYSQYIVWGEAMTREAAGHVPPRVALQHNFESAGRNRQLGKWRKANDYWLSYVGPSDTFRQCARRAVRSGRRMFAKLQVGCSHEVATAPCVPAPGILYAKYRAMRDLGVSGAMQCWYFGNFPSIMTRAAGELSFAPFPKSEREFLLVLARRDWQKDAPSVARAWRYFRKGYEQYPTSQFFGYYGPMHDGPVWPLHLEPRNLPLAPTWKLEYPPSGDRIGESFPQSHSLEEVLILCRRMVSNWHRGAEILRKLRPRYLSDPDRTRDINTALALDLQFRSGLNILTFYALRERLIAQKGNARLVTLDRLRAVVEEELRIDRQLLPLCSDTSALGFHSEAEGYKYYPERIRWRMNQLRALLKREFPRVRKQSRSGAPLFTEYTGANAGNALYVSRLLSRKPSMNGIPQGGVWDSMPEEVCRKWTDCEGKMLSTPPRKEYERWAAHWRVGHDRRALYVGARCDVPDLARFRKSLAQQKGHDGYWSTQIVLRIEPRRLFPGYWLAVTPKGSRLYRDFEGGTDEQWSVAAHAGDDQWSATFRIPFATLGLDRPPDEPIRFRIFSIIGDFEWGRLQNSWVKPHPLPGRLAYGEENPATDFGWLRFEKRRPPSSMNRRDFPCD